MLGATPNPLFNQPIYGPDKVVEIKQKADKLYGMKKRAVALGIAVGAALAIAAPVSAQVKPTPISGYPISGYPDLRLRLAREPDLRLPVPHLTDLGLPPLARLVAYGGDMEAWHRVHAAAMKRGADEDDAVASADTGLWPEELGVVPDEIADLVSPLPPLPSRPGSPTLREQ
jgi:hypothetical protein